MQLKFDSSLEYQQKAISAVVDLFLGQEHSVSRFEINSQYQSNPYPVLFHNPTNTVPNNLNIDDETILENLQSIQKDNGLDVSSRLSEKAFSIEMETGTGKTYVYLRTIFELNKKYGFLKFIVVVPNIAIREGVKSSLELMSDHFKGIYNNVPFCYFVYDSSKLNQVRDFDRDDKIQIMIMNIQSFQKDDENLKGLNVINRENDKMQGCKPIEFIQRTNPIIIIDEPQSVDNTAKAKAAIAKLNPLVTLRYSATHRESKNLIYRLNPVDAYKQELVKRIEIASVREDNNFNDAYIKLLKLDNKKGIKAYVEIHQKLVNEVKPKKLWVKQSDNLYEKSKKHYVYNDRYVLSAIDCSDKGYIEFNNGKILKLNQELGSASDEIMQAQIRTTIKEHLEKESEFEKRNIKVLSLFFIDEVASYRLYGNNSTSLGKIGNWFETIYKEECREFLQKYPHSLKHLKDFKIEELHGGYFSEDKKHNFKNTNGGTKDDEDTYRLIMSDKEKLLNPSNPLRFIFSHSALKEGWDNPNVFQVCILREVRSNMTRRQQIGRGLRLAVDASGNRIHDTKINCLTVIANESYEDFAKNLQEEFENDGIEFSKQQIKNKKDRRKLELNEEVFKSKDFKNLWDQISQRTRYRIDLKTNELVKKAVDLINNNLKGINEPRVIIKTAKISIEDSGVNIKKLNDDKSFLKITQTLPDIITYLVKETGLVRSTICCILKESKSFEYFKKNPQAYLITVAKQINDAKRDLIFKTGIKYEKIDSCYWDMKQIQKDTDGRIENYKDELYPIENKHKSIFNYVKYDSETEKAYVKDLDSHEKIKLFFKLPSWFVISTPIGAYNPDWAFILQKNNHNTIYLVRETKSTTDQYKLRPEENAKVKCGEKHFNEIGVDFKTTKELSEDLT
ncbi:MAG: DEAD/DEAH box helicase family protein [Paraclostridium sp.]